MGMTPTNPAWLLYLHFLKKDEETAWIEEMIC